MTRTKTQKPPKPYPGFPLTAHPNGQWCKKIKGKLHYFGSWENWQDALALFQEQRDDLYAGRTPRRQGDGPTLAELMDRFLYSKKVRKESDEMTARSYADYERTCDKIEASIATSRLLSDLRNEDFEKLRADFSKGQGPTTLKGDLGRARMVFNYAYESGLTETPIRYGKTLKTPHARVFRRLANARGERMFTREEVLALVKKAGVQLKAMIYMGVNCGFGNEDCGTLPMDRLDLKGGWHKYGRPKTGILRRCPLWPETVAALKEVIARRKPSEDENLRNLVFVTKYGNCWCSSEEDRSNPISYEFRKLVKELGFYRKGVTTFYSLRRTFSTIGNTVGEKIAVDFIMGHIAATDDMSAIYRQKTFDGPLKKVTDHVRDWLLGVKCIE
ncbi:MAG: tyrosine-type recombinase/integrase [Thermoguttaceae bacterium]